MSSYFSGPKPPPLAPAAAPKGGGISPANTKLLAEGKGPLKAPAKATGGRVANTERVAKAPAPPKNFDQAVALEKQVKARVQAQFPKLPGFAIDHIVKLQLTPGPKGDAGAQLNAADLASAQQIGVRPTVPGAILAATAKGLVHPVTDLLSGPSSFTGAASDVANLASNVLTPEKVGLTAGLFGAKGLKDAKAGDDAFQAFKDAKAAAPEATAQLKEGLKGSRSVYGKERVLKSEETARRAQEVAKIHATVKDPQEAMAQVSAVLRGKYPTVEYNGLKELTPETVKQLQTIVQAHPRLPELSKHNTMKAIQAAAEGRNPRPHELRMIETVFGKKTASSFVDQARQGLWDKTLNVANIPRSMQTFLDVSGLMRQNLVAGVSHPAIFASNLPKAFQGMKGANFERFAQAIKDDPDYPMALQAGIQFTDIGEHSSLAAHEEGFQSDYATKIPVVGRAIKASARSYVTTGNEMKMGLFKNRLRLAQAAGQNVNDEKTLKQIGQVINAATGRGTLPEPLDHLLPAMNTFMFSPRLMLSRLHYFDPTWYVRLKGPARREALRGLFATAGGVTTALYLFSRIPGVEVGSLDPTSADFGKLKINNTRIDIAGGFQQYVHLAAELLEGAETSSTTGKKTKLGSGFGIPTRLDVLENFGLNKLAPIPGLGANLLRGHDAIGGSITPPGEGKKTYGIPFGTIPPNYFVPLVIQDAKDIYREKHGGINGLAWALGGYGLDATGISEQTYAPKTPKATSGSGSSSYFGGPSSSGGSDYFGSP